MHTSLKMYIHIRTSSLSPIGSPRELRTNSTTAQKLFRSALSLLFQNIQKQRISVKTRFIYRYMNVHPIQPWGIHPTPPNAMPRPPQTTPGVGMGLGGEGVNPLWGYFHIEYIASLCIHILYKNHYTHMYTHTFCFVLDSVVHPSRQSPSLHVPGFTYMYMYTYTYLGVYTYTHIQKTQKLINKNITNTAWCLATLRPDNHFWTLMCMFDNCSEVVSVRA